MAGKSILTLCNHKVNPITNSTATLPLSVFMAFVGALQSVKTNLRVSIQPMSNVYMSIASWNIVGVGKHTKDDLFY